LSSIFTQCINLVTVHGDCKQKTPALRPGS
jgi:hypothetical protein